MPDSLMFYKYMSFIELKEFHQKYLIPLGVIQSDEHIVSTFNRALNDENTYKHLELLYYYDNQFKIDLDKMIEFDKESFRDTFENLKYNLDLENISDYYEYLYILNLIKSKRNLYSFPLDIQSRKNITRLIEDSNYLNKVLIEINKLRSNEKDLLEYQQKNIKITFENKLKEKPSILNKKIKILSEHIGLKDIKYLIVLSSYTRTLSNEEEITDRDIENCIKLLNHFIEGIYSKYDKNLDLNIQIFKEKKR